VSGEESAEQVALRASRLQLDAHGLQLLPEINLERILGTLRDVKPDVAVVDSIQTYSETLGSAPGSVAQVRECAAQLTRFAKQGGTTLIMVGHVTKDGAWPARGCWSTSSTRCCTSRATPTPASAWCGPSRTASARSMSWASSR
jgi:predicted ATP-dependent serine protease